MTIFSRLRRRVLFLPVGEEEATGQTVPQQAVHRSPRDTVVSRTLRLSRDAFLAAHGTRDLFPSQGPTRSSAAGGQVYVGGEKERGCRQKSQRAGGPLDEGGRLRHQSNLQLHNFRSAYSTIPKTNYSWEVPLHLRTKYSPNINDIYLSLVMSIDIVIWLTVAFFHITRRLCNIFTYLLILRVSQDVFHHKQNN